MFDRTGPSFTLPDSPFLAENGFGRETATGAEITVLPDPTFGQIYHVSWGNLANDQQTTNEYFSFFVQDTWQVGNLTVRPGLRYDQQTPTGDKRFPICREGETRPGEADGDGAPMPCTFTLDDSWAARVGVAYDILGNGRSKVYFNFGRFYAKVPNDLAVRLMSADPATTRADYFDAALTQPVPEGVMAAGTPSHFRLSGLTPGIWDPDTNSTFKNEYVSGFEFEALPSVSLGVRYIHRNMDQVLEDVNVTSLASFFTDPSSRGSIEFFFANPRDGFAEVVAGPGLFEAPIHQYDAVEITANKAVRRQLVTRGLVSLLATGWHLRGLLPERQRPVRPRFDLVVRFSDQ